MKDEILAWLKEGQPYEKGVELYAKYGNNSTLLKNFNRKRIPSRQAKLAYKLVKIAKLPEKYLKLDLEQLPEIDTNNQTQTTTTPAPDLTPKLGSTFISEHAKNYQGKTPFKDLPKEIKILIVDRGELAKKRSEVHMKLHSIAKTNTEENKKERLAVLEEIKTINGEYCRVKALIDAYEETGKLPVETTPAPEPPKSDAEKVVELTKTHNNLKSQRSKYRNKINGNAKKNTAAMPESPKKEAAKKKLAEIEKEIATTEAELKKYE